MARITTVAKARESKKERRCRCGHLVEAGEPYKYINKRVGFGRISSLQLVFCKDCHPRASDTLSGRAAEAARMEEDFDAAVNAALTTDDLRGALEEYKSEVESLKDQFEESGRNIEEGFGHSTEMSERFGDITNELDEFVSRIDEVMDGLQDYEPAGSDGTEKEGESESGADDDSDADHDDSESEEDEEWNDFFSEQVSEVSEVTGEMPDISV